MSARNGNSSADAVVIVRDVDLGSNTQNSESLLYRDSPSADAEQFEKMKGLEHLAKLSIEDTEFNNF